MYPPADWEPFANALYTHGSKITKDWTTVKNILLEENKRRAGTSNSAELSSRTSANQVTRGSRNKRNSANFAKKTDIPEYAQHTMRKIVDIKRVPNFKRRQPSQLTVSP